MALSKTKKIVFSLLPCLILLTGTELVLRLIGFQFEPRQKELYKPVVSAFYGTTQPYFDTEFDPPGYLWIRQEHIAYEETDGARHYVWPMQKEPGKLRIGFVGGSTVESHPGSSLESFPELCGELLNLVAGTDRYEIINVGCSSYSTHQSLLALQRYLLPRKPDVVVLYDGWNDFSVVDGYSDREKDFWIRALGESSFQSPGWLRRLRVNGLIGKLVQTLDLSWPRPRCNPTEFRKNLMKATRLCLDNGIQPVVALKPISRHLPANSWADTPIIRVFGPALGNTQEQIYTGLHKYATDAQLAVIEKYPEARLADLQARLARAQDEIGSPQPEGVGIFINDAMHCTALGNYFVAETVAEAIAPDLAEQIRKYAASSENFQRMAIGLEKIGSPFEAAFAAQQAIKLNPDCKESMSALITRAEQDFEFKRAFELGHWDNAMDISWEDRMALLLRCQEIRPSDLGVALQIMRVSTYMGHLPDAAEALALFQPANAIDCVEWLWMLCQSHIAGQRWADAEWDALQILEIDQQHQGASAILMQLSTYRQSQGYTMPM